MRSEEARFKITRRRLPHWWLEGASYFVTFRLAASPLAEEEILLVRDHIISGGTKFYDLIAAAVLPSHVHLLLRPRKGVSLSRAMKGIKGVTARSLNQRRGRRGSLWQDESYDRIVRDERELFEKLNYMLLNAVKAELTTDPENYVGWFLNREA